MAGWATPRRSGRHHSHRQTRSHSRTVFFLPNQQTRLRWLELAPRICLIATWLVTLLVFAGRTPRGQLCLLLGTLLTLFCFVVQRVFCRKNTTWRLTGLEPVFLLLLLFLVLQLLPLPQPLLQTIAAGQEVFIGHPAIAAEVVADVPAELQATSWDTISLDPYATRLSLSSIACVILLFLLTVQLFPQAESFQRLIIGLCWGMVGFALFGIIQYLTGNGKFFWLIEHPLTYTMNGAKGTYTNPNQFAGLLAVALGPLLCWTLVGGDKIDKKSHDWSRMSRTPSAELKSFVGALGCAILLLGIVLSVSRGALLLAAVCLTSTLLLLILLKLTDQRFPLLVAILGMISLGGIAYFGEETLQANSHQLTTADWEELDDGDARGFIWRANLRALQAFPWTGIGLGGHRVVIPAFQDATLFKRVYTHAESGYLQIGSELGIPGLMILAVVVFVSVRRLATLLRNGQLNRHQKGTLAGLAGSLAVMLVHGIYDFHWYAPASVLLFAILMAALFIDWSPVTKSTTVVRPSSAPYLLGTLLLFVIVGTLPSVWQASEGEKAEWEYLIMARRGQQFDTVDEELEWLKIRTRLLQQAVAADPDNHEHYLRLSSSLRRVLELQLAHTPGMMPLPQLRAAIYQGGFTDSEQVREWLKNPAVMGQQFALAEACLEAAQQSTERCRFQQKAWINLAGYAFLHSPNPRLTDYYLEQARKVEPHSAEVAFFEGYYAWNMGDWQTAINKWQTIFTAHRALQRQIVELTAPSFSPDEMIEFFKPDYPGLIAIMRGYNDPGHPHHQLAATRLAEFTFRKLAQQPLKTQENMLIVAFNNLQTSQQHQQARYFGEQACTHYPEFALFRKTYGLWLADQKDYSTALKHLQIVEQTYSYDPQLRRTVEKCKAELALRPTSNIRPAGYSEIPHDSAARRQIQ